MDFVPSVRPISSHLQSSPFNLCPRMHSRFGGYHPTTAAEWTSILHLSTLWSFADIRALAIESLQTLPMHPVDKVVLSHKYGIRARWTLDAYVELCERADALSVEEARRLGLETAMRVVQVRERIYRRSGYYGSSGAGSPETRRSLDLGRSVGAGRSVSVGRGVDGATGQTMRRASVSGSPLGLGLARGAQRLPIVPRLVAQTFGFELGEHT